MRTAAAMAVYMVPFIIVLAFLDLLFWAVGQ